MTVHGRGRTIYRYGDNYRAPRGWIYRRGGGGLSLALNGPWVLPEKRQN